MSQFLQHATVPLQNKRYERLRFLHVHYLRDFSKIMIASIACFSTREKA
jgi:hypothetical protein